MHTPGNWEVESGVVVVKHFHNGRERTVPIARMDRESGNGTQPVARDANARLITAAPELLEAAKELAAIWNPRIGTSLRGALDAMEAAISKATNGLA